MLYIWRNEILYEITFTDFQEAYTSLSLGDGLFETTRIAKSKIYFLEEHLQRLKKSAAYLYKKNLSFNSMEMTQAIIKQSGQNEFHRLKLSWLPSISNSLLIEIKPFQPVNNTLTLLSDKNISTSVSKFKEFKTLSYGENLWLSKLAREKGYDDFLICDQRGNIIETTKANIFFLKEYEKTLFIDTPSANNLLPGIVRKKVIDFLRNNKNVKVQEKNINLSDLTDYDACFTTNSLRFIMDVNRINDIIYSKSADCKFLISKNIEYLEA